MSKTDDVDPFEPTQFLTQGDDVPAEDPTFDLGPGTVVGDYEIEGKLGQGGMGVVYSAVHPLIGKRAAIKVLKRELCMDRRSVARFVDEARVVNKIGHPNIVDIFTMGELPDGSRYLVMEWLQGESLRSLLATRSLALTETCHLLRSLARALDAAHDKGVIHRDLKPDNVFLVPVRNDRPLIKLLDFGIAKLVHPDQRIERTATNAMIGTPLYIAPEQARNEVIDHRTDIYALGAIAFEVLTGHPPFLGATVMEVVAKHMLEPAVRPSTVKAGLPHELDDLVVTMLEKEPSSRPSLADLMRVLDRVEQSALLSHSVNTPVPMVPRTETGLGPYQTGPDRILGAPALAITQHVSRRRWLLPVVAISTLAIAGLVIGVVTFGGRSETIESSEPTTPQPGNKNAKPPESANPVAKPTEPKAEETKPEPVTATPGHDEQASTVEPKPSKKDPAKTTPKAKPKRKPAGSGSAEELIMQPGSIPR